MSCLLKSQVSPSNGGGCITDTEVNDKALFFFLRHVWWTLAMSTAILQFLFYYRDANEFCIFILLSLCFSYLYIELYCSIFRSKIRCKWSLQSEKLCPWLDDIIFLTFSFILIRVLLALEIWLAELHVHFDVYFFCKSTCRDSWLYYLMFKVEVCDSCSADIWDDDVHMFVLIFFSS